MELAQPLAGWPVFVLGEGGVVDRVLGGRAAFYLLMRVRRSDAQAGEWRMGKEREEVRTEEGGVVRAGCRGAEGVGGWNKPGQVMGEGVVVTEGRDGSQAWC